MAVLLGSRRWRSHLCHWRAKWSSGQHRGSNKHKLKVYVPAQLNRYSLSCIGVSVYRDTLILQTYSDIMLFSHTWKHTQLTLNFAPLLRAYQHISTPHNMVQCHCFQPVAVWRCWLADVGLTCGRTLALLCLPLLSSLYQLSFGFGTTFKSLCTWELWLASGKHFTFTAMLQFYIYSDVTIRFLCFLLCCVA